MRLRRKLIATFSTAAITGLALLAILTVTGRAGPPREAGRGDCTFLQRPEEFLEAQQARREALQELTYGVTSKLPQRVDAVMPLAPRNIVDVYIFAKTQRDGIPPAALSSDTEFLRRVY